MIIDPIPLVKDPRYVAIERQSLKYSDLEKWDSQRFVQAFKFLDCFYKPVVVKKKTEWKLQVENDIIIALEYRVKENAEDEFIEFIYRIGEWSEPYNPHLSRQFNIRLSVMVGVIRKYITKFPHVLTNVVKEYIDGKPQYAWAFEERGKIEDKTDVAGELLTIDLTKDISVATAQRMMIEAMVRVANIYNALASSIKMEDLQKLPIKDKIDAIKKLSYVHEATKGFKPTKLVINNINPKSAGKEELEHAALNFANEPD